ncbi:MAG: hypothetical protein GX334_08500 [Firmicutes bacterium]|nr:hypothetical protein [Bacillota bacterium]
MPKAQSSSSFQDELRQSLLEKGWGTGGNVTQKNKTNDLFAGVLKFSQKHLSYYALTAATVIMVVALALFHNGGLVGSGLGNDKLPDPYTAMTEQKKPAGQVPSSETFPSIIEEGPAVKPPASGPETGLEGVGTEGAGETPAIPPGGDVFPAPGQPANEPEPGVGTEPKEDPNEPVPPAVQAETPPPETDFKVEQNLRSFKAAGKISLPPVFYRTTPAETATPVEKINQAWKPRKTVVSMLQSEARSIATPEWAKEILTNEGFPVREGDTLESRLRETSAGALVEVSYLPHKGSLQELPVVLHYEEGKGIIAYYYQEDGKVLPPGFYALLSPAKAFEQVQGVEWYAASPRLDFSFQEVYLTYYDFPVGVHDAPQKQRLPAYCFLGRETFNNGGELKLYLPAVH